MKDNERQAAMARCFSLSLLGLCAVFGLVSCDYGHKQYRPSPASTPTLTAPLVVEVDDFGRFWDRKSANETLQAIAKASLNTNTIVVVFVHGWHHNADEADTHFLAFQTTVEQLRTKLTEAAYVKARERLGLKEGIQVIGLYVGWRGRSLPGVFDYFTFWGRKSAAEQVGGGDLREFFVNLQKVYLDRNRSVSSGKPTFMGLLTVGHSFGAQVLFKAISQAFESDLINATARAGIRTDEAKIQLLEIVSGLGDLTVLLNPSLEAFQYERIDRLTKQISFNAVQAPVLLAVSAEDDRARKYWFPVARNLNVLFRPRFQNDEVKQLWTTALGEHEPQQTHILTVTDRPSTIHDSLFSDCRVAEVDLTDSLVLNGAQLSPKPTRHRPFSPVVIAYTSSKLVQEHSGIFGATFNTFLTDYVGFIQAKRLCLIRGR